VWRLGGLPKRYWGKRVLSKKERVTQERHLEKCSAGQAVDGKLLLHGNPKKERIRKKDMAERRANGESTAHCINTGVPVNGNAI